MSYNIQGHAAAGRDDHLPKIAEVITATAPDVVGLQEVHCRTRVARVDQAERLAALTGYQLAFGRSCAMDGGDYGNAILSRGRIVATSVHPLPGSGEPRSALEAEIVVNGVTLNFFSTHLAAWGRLLRIARLKQIARLADITAASPNPTLVVGDFNVSPGADELRMLLARGHLRIAGDVTEASFPMTRQRLDYILCDDRWEVGESQVIHRGPSDHWAVTVDLSPRD